MRQGGKLLEAILEVWPGAVTGLEELVREADRRMCAEKELRKRENCNEDT